MLAAKTIRRCKCGCGASLNKKHPNARFLSQRHKDNFWNLVNPRGYGIERIEREKENDAADAFEQDWQNGKDY